MYRLFNEYYVITCYIHFSSALHTFILFILEHIGTSTFRHAEYNKVFNYDASSLSD